MNADNKPVQPWHRVQIRLRRTSAQANQRSPWDMLEDQLADLLESQGLVIGSDSILFSSLDGFEGLITAEGSDAARMWEAIEPLVRGAECGSGSEVVLWGDDRLHPVATIPLSPG